MCTFMPCTMTFTGVVTAVDKETLLQRIMLLALMVNSQICRDNNMIRYYVTSVNETAVLLLMISACLPAMI